MPQGGVAYISIVAGNSDHCGLTSVGQAYCWGNNSQGQLGDNTTTDRTSPVAVRQGGVTFALISAAFETTCGITGAGQAYCWGKNSYGQIGDNTTTDRHTPVAVQQGGTTLASISISSNSTCALTGSGAAYCWGYGGNGRLGDGTQTQRLTPVAVQQGAVTFASIAVGAAHGCGLTSAGSAYCWGANGNGQLGDNTTNERLTPVAVQQGGITFISVITGYYHTCGLTNGGAAYCWGLNTNGQLGDGTTTQRNAPVAVQQGGVISSTVVTGAQSNHNCAVQASAQLVYCWGSNNAGQLGDTTNTDRMMPIKSWYRVTVLQTDASVTIDPTFTFTVANQALACNSELNFVTGAGTASAVALAHLSAGNNVSGGEALSVGSNAGGGFAVYIRGAQGAQNLRSAGHNWSDVTGTYGTPAALGAGEAFGYTYRDATSATSVTNPAPANFIALDNTARAVMGSSSSPIGAGCVSFDAKAAAATPAGSYTAIITFVAVPNF